MIKKSVAASRRLSRLNLNADSKNPELNTYWCRVASSGADKWNYKEHSHSFFELQMCLGGGCCFLVDGIVHRLEKGTFLLLPPQKKHTLLEATEDFCKLVWGFSVEDKELSCALAENSNSVELKTADKCIIPAVEVILDNTDFSKFGAYNIIKNQLNLIFTYLIRDFTSMGGGDVLEKKTSAVAEGIRAFILDNIGTKMHTSDIAAQFFLTERQLAGVCMRDNKMTVSELKRGIRLELIKQLLPDTDLSLEEIAARTGCSDEFTMSKFFKKHEGMPPGKFRDGMKA